MMKTAHQIVSRRVDVYDIFKSADPLHIGKLDASDFSRSISFSGIQLLPQEVSDICNYYHDGKFIDYVRFCQDIQKVAQSLSGSIPRKQNPEPQPFLSPRSGMANTYSIFSNLQGYHSINSLPELINKLRQDFANRRISPSSFFNNSLTTQYQFRKNLQTSGLNITRDEIELLVSSFSNPDATIDMQKFLDELNGTRQELPDNCTSILQRLQSFLINRREYLRKYLLPFDREGRGEISGNLLVRPLHKLGLTLQYLYLIFQVNLLEISIMKLFVI